MWAGGASKEARFGGRPGRDGSGAAAGLQGVAGKGQSRRDRGSAVRSAQAGGRGRRARGPQSSRALLHRGQTGWGATTPHGKPLRTARATAGRRDSLAHGGMRQCSGPDRGGGAGSASGARSPPRGVATPHFPPGPFMAVGRTGLCVLLLAKGTAACRGRVGRFGAIQSPGKTGARVRGVARLARRA